MSVLLFFIDGLGIGLRGASNPFDGLDGAAPLAVFQGEELKTIFDGINAPAQLGHHKQGFPNAALLEIIKEHSIFLQLREAGITSATFANAYTQRFFADRPRWISATTAAVEAAELKFRTISD